MARRYRCINCHTDFVADKPACTRCAIDAATDPRAVGIIHPIVTIHYDPPHPQIKHRGLGHPACNPRRSIAGLRGTAEPSAVNCEACQATETFRAAVAKGGLNLTFLEDDDEIVTPPAAGVTVDEHDCGCGKG